MKKYLLLFILLLNFSYAQSIKAGYDVSFGIIGEIGQSEITYTQDRDNYLVHVYAYTTGLSAFLTQNRQESYFSQGKIINGTLVPNVFVKYRKNNSGTSSKVFRFNHTKKKVFLTLAHLNNISSTKYSVKTMKSIDVQTEEFTFKKGQFRYYTDNDLLSLFFNTKKLFNSLLLGESREFSAIGSKTPNCKIDLSVPDGKLRSELKAILSDNDDKLLTIIVHQDIFQSKNGHLHINFDNDGFAKDVLLKDVIMFGDIRAKRSYQTVSKN